MLSKILKKRTTKISFSWSCFIFHLFDNCVHCFSTRPQLQCKYHLMLRRYYSWHSQVVIFSGLFMFLAVCLCTSSLLMLWETKSLSKMSLSKRSSHSEFSLDGNLYLMSIDSTGSQLYSKLKGEYFVEDFH